MQTHTRSTPISNILILRIYWFCIELRRFALRVGRAVDNIITLLDGIATELSPLIGGLPEHENFQPPTIMEP